jgi:hypothetical protein
MFFGRQARCRGDCLGPAYQRRLSFLLSSPRSRFRPSLAADRPQGFLDDAYRQRLARAINPHAALLAQRLSVTQRPDGELLSGPLQFQIISRQQTEGITNRLRNDNPSGLVDGSFINTIVALISNDPLRSLKRARVRKDPTAALAPAASVDGAKTAVILSLHSGPFWSLLVME